MGTRRVALAAVFVAMTAVVGCSGDGDDETDDSDDGSLADVPADVGVTLTFAPDAEASVPELDRAATVVEERIEALDIDASVTADAEEGTVRVAVADDDPEVVDQVTRTVETRGELRFRPVLAEPSDDATPPTPPEEDRPDVPVVLADEAGVVRRLGPAELTGDAVESAAAQLGPQPSVALVLRNGDEGIGAFNRLAERCFDADETCPTSQVAIVLDSVVQSAPSVQQPAFERDQIAITGLDVDEVRALAAALETGALPFSLVLQG